MSDPICFISYANEDISSAHTLYRRLREAGLSPWMDKPPAPYTLEGLKPGELWEDRLRDAISTSKYFLPLFSSISVEKIGYVQSEFRQALTKLALIPAGQTYVLPIRIEECGIPKTRIDGISFSQYQYIDCFNGYFKDLVTHLSKLEGKTVEPSANRSVEVHSPEEFLEAIGSNTEILIKSNISLTDIAVPNNRHVFVREVFDGEEYVIRDIENLKIVGDGSSKITVEPRYATTLNFLNCHGVVIKDLTLGHWPDIGDCQGAVLNFDQSSSIEVSNSKIFGCGTYGFELNKCEFVRFENCDIFECSYGLFTAKETSQLKLINVDFYDNVCFDGILLQNSELLIEKCTIKNNKAHWERSSIFKEYRSKIYFSETIIDMSDFMQLGINENQQGLQIIRNNK